MLELLPPELLPAVNWAGETVIVLAAFVAAAAAAGKSPRLRLCLYRCAFTVALLAPLAALPQIERPALITVAAAPAASDASVAGDSKAATSAIVSAAGAPGAGSVPAAIRGGPGFWLELPYVLLVLWLTGALAVVGRYCSSWLHLRRVYRTAAPAPPAMARRLDLLRPRFEVAAAELRISTSVSAPCVFGWYRPKILLPAGAVLPGEALDAVLAHELCHIRNLDPLWLMLGELACAMHWYNPLIWRCLRRHREEIEIVCDAAVTEREIAVPAYMRALVQTAQSIVCRRASAGATMSTNGILFRLRMLGERERPLPPLQHRSKVVAYGVSCIAVTLLGGADLVIARAAATGESAAAELSIAAQPAPRVAPPRSSDRGLAVAVNDPPAPVEAEPGKAGAEHAPAAAGAQRRPSLASSPATSGRLYLTVPDGVTVWARQIGFMCSGIACVATVPAGTELILTAESGEAGSVSWSGCAPSVNEASCSLRVPAGAANVSVSLQQLSPDSA